MAIKRGRIMSKMKAIEFVCDYCGNADHVIMENAQKGYRNKSPEYTIRKNGWVITADGHHFDTRECYQNYKRGNQ